MGRQKLSTTIGPESYAYLRRQVKSGRAASVGEAVDKAIGLARQLENRAKLERATAAYFRGLPAKAAAEEAELENLLSEASGEIDFVQP